MDVGRRDKPDGEVDSRIESDCVFEDSKSCRRMDVWRDGDMNGPMGRQIVNDDNII